MTETFQKDEYDQPGPKSYEVEIELIDMTFILSQPDRWAIYVDRLISNLDTFIRVKADSHVKIFDVIVMPEAKQNYEQEYEGNEHPAVGDYLYQKALEYQGIV